jgi:hypothetical protein
MAKAAQVLKASLHDILVQGSDASLQADEYQDAIFAMNNYMTALDANGIKLGYTVVGSLSDEITIPDGAVMGLIANLAILLAPQFNANVSQGLVTKAKIGMRAMQKLGITYAPTEMPSTMPIGVNQDGHDQRFYPGAADSIVDETGQSIELESST